MPVTKRPKSAKLSKAQKVMNAREAATAPKREDMREPPEVW
jgi:hypothetical protein